MGFFDLFKKKEKTYICARCKKEITDEETKWIGNHRFCSNCATPIKKATITQEKHIDVSTNDVDESCWKDRWGAERLSVMKQLEELQKKTKECNKVIGKIYKQLSSFRGKESAESIF